MAGSRFAGAIVAAQVLAQIGAFTLPALLPALIERWSLSATEAGWLIGAFFAAYVATVPVLVALTDRVPARRVYLLGTAATAMSHLGFALLADGFWSVLALRVVAGIGWAGCYMPELKAIADRPEGTAQSRAVSWHVAGVGIAGAASFVVAGVLDALAGPEAAFLFWGAAAAAAFAIGAAIMPRTAPRREAGVAPAALLDFRPVLRNRAAMAWIAGYTVHTWEMAALRAWGVTFLAAAIARHGAPAWLPGPSVLFTVAGLIGIAVSVSGNETAQRISRARVVAAAIGVGAAMSLLTGWSIVLPAPLAVLCVLAWNAAIYLDSAAQPRARCRRPIRRGGARRWACTACAATPASSSGRSGRSRAGPCGSGRGPRLGARLRAPRPDHAARVLVPTPARPGWLTPRRGAAPAGRRRPRATGPR